MDEKKLFGKQFFYKWPRIRPRMYIRRTFREGKHIRSYVTAIKKCSSRKSWSRILIELLLIAKKWKIIPFNYFRQALYDMNTPYADEFLSFMPEPVLFTSYMDLLSPRRYRIIVHNKYFFHELLQFYGVQTPEILLWSFSGTIYCNNHVIQDEISLGMALEANIGRNFVLKPQNGARGENIRFLYVFKSNSRTILKDNKDNSYSYHQLRSYSQRDDWILEEKVLQHPEISAIYPHSVNTIRIVTLHFPDGHTEILCALMRIGRNSSMVDNASAGGIHVHIDIDRGQLTDTAYCKTENLVFREHPDTKCIFNGMKIPFWDQVLSTVERLSKIFMQTHTIAWDIAVNETGPIIIEGNPFWNPGTMERGSYPKADKIIAAAKAWKTNQIIDLYN